MAQSIHVILKNVRCTYPKLHQAEEYNGKTRYSVGLILPEGSDQLKTVQDACLKAVASRYGESKVASQAKKFSQSKTTWPLKEIEGGYLITPKRDVSKGAPNVLDRHCQNIPADSGLPYGGCWLNVSLDVYCYDKQGGGVTSYLNGVQLVKEDAALDGSATAASTRNDFADLGDQGEDDTGIPF